MMHDVGDRLKPLNVLQQGLGRFQVPVRVRMGETLPILQILPNIIMYFVADNVL